MAELDLLKARLNPEIRNVLPKMSPRSAFRRAKSCQEFAERFGAQPALAGLWPTSRHKLRTASPVFQPMLTSAADTTAGSIQTAAVFKFCEQLLNQKSDAGMYMDQYVLLCSSLELMWSGNAHETLRSMMKVPEAKFLDPLPDGAPPASGPSWMSLPYCLSKLKVPSAQACAAQSAAVASFMLGQYMGALQSFPKRGVSSVGQAHDMAVLADTVGHPRQACLHEALQQELKKHTAWSQGLKLSLQRLCTAYQDSGTNSCEWVLASQEVHAMMQTKPNNFQISLDVFPESVFQDASEWFDAACWSQVRPLAHELIAAKDMLLIKEQKNDDAFELL
ncbi:TPA: hypothetical protein ACH3X1_015667 [Trebouxia sp. C0004]